MTKLTKESVKNVYGSGASQYENVMATYWQFDRKGLINLLCHRLPCRVLEIGVGTGLNLPYYPSDIDVTGIDFTPEMLAVARMKLSSMEGTHLHLIEMDAAQMGFPDDSFDAALESFALCVVPDIYSVLSEVSRVTKRGAAFAIFDYCKSRNPEMVKWQELIAPSALTNGFPPGVIVCDTLRDYVEIIETAGIPFEIELSERLESENPFLIACRLLLRNRKR